VTTLFVQGAKDEDGNELTTLLGIEQEAKEGDKMLDKSKARIDIDSEVDNALKASKQALLSFEYAENNRPRRGSVEDVQKRLNKQFEELG